MWSGKNTKELNKLKKKYEEVFGYNPDKLLGVEYYDDDYDEYVADIKEAISTGVDLDVLFDTEEDW